MAKFADERARRGLAFAELSSTYAPSPFSSGAVPTGPAFYPGSSGFLEGLVDVFPEVADDAARMKWAAPDYVYGGLIFFRAKLLPAWTGIAIVTARAGDGELRTEWIFASSGGETPRPFYTPAPGTDLGSHGGHTNDLAAKALRTGELGVTRHGRHARLESHHPSLDAFSEPEVRAHLAAKQVAARSQRRARR